MAKPGRSRFHQVAALPWRRRPDGGVEVVLVTSRERHRWILPKGWPIRGLGDSEAAATEAMEEAGLIGTAGREPVGSFSYGKRFPKRTEIVSVDVYPLEVHRILDDWPEKGQREVRWFSPAEAASAAADRGVDALILSFAAGILGNAGVPASGRPG